MAQESEWLDPALTLIKKTRPNTDADRHAFLINAYNLWTIYWVIRERRYVFAECLSPTDTHVRALRFVFLSCSKCAETVQLFPESLLHIFLMVRVTSV